MSSCKLWPVSWELEIIGIPCIGVRHGGGCCAVICSDRSKQQMEQNQFIQWMIRIQQYYWENFAIWLSCPIQLWLEDDWLYLPVGINWKIPLKDSDCLGWDHMPNPWPMSRKQRWSITTSTSTGHTGLRGRRNSSPHEVMPYSQKKGEEQGRKQTNNLNQVLNNFAVGFLQ